MKLIYCPLCQDVVRLKFTTRFCSCKKSSGVYIDDLNAEIYGDAIPIGFQNSSFMKAIKSQRENESIKFEAFVIPKVCKTIKKSR
jgi:hypothetical protein